MPHKGWEMCAKHSDWCLPSTELETCKWKETGLLRVVDLGSKPYQPELSSLHRVGGQTGFGKMNG